MPTPQTDPSRMSFLRSDPNLFKRMQGCVQMHRTERMPTPQTDPSRMSFLRSYPNLFKRMQGCVRANPCVRKRMSAPKTDPSSNELPAVVSEPLQTKVGLRANACGRKRMPTPQTDPSRMSFLRSHPNLSERR